MAKLKPNLEREEFHQRVARLHGLLEGADAQDLTAAEHEALDILHQLLGAMDKLALGEETDIFRPGPKNPRGSGTPSKIQHRRWRAVFYVEAMQRSHKMLVSTAIRKVAKAFGVPHKTLTFWRKSIINKKTDEADDVLTFWHRLSIINKKTDEADALNARRKIEDWLSVRRKDDEPAGILDRAKAEGASLMPPKKPAKKAKKPSKKGPPGAKGS